MFYDRQLKVMNWDGQLLYFAPEGCNLTYLKGNARLDIKTSEYDGKTADYNVDIMNIAFPDDSWDFIICHRVIEHVPDDHKAMRELYRILKPGGKVILSVPIYRDTTVEYGAPNPLEDDHFYDYGLDFQDRIPKEFRTTRHAFSELFSRREFEEDALIEDYVFVCEKQAPAVVSAHPISAN